MKSLLDDVGAFHKACGVPAYYGTPWSPTADRVMLRISLIDEEVNRELFPAMKRGDIVGVADALADAIYVIVGTALEYGIPLDRVWDAVQRSNMAKVDPDTGKVRKREDGKILKPEGWVGPDIAAVISE